MQTSQNPRTALPALVIGYTLAIPIYIAVTYASPAHPALSKPNIAAVFAPLAVIIVFVGVLVEAVMMRRASSAVAVQMAGLYSAAFGEAPAILGLVAFFLTRQRLWFLFALAGVYFLGLLLRLPGMLRKIDELNR